MPSTEATVDAPRTRALARGVLGTCAMAVGLGSAGAIAHAVQSRTGMSDTSRQVLIAALCLLITASLIVLLRRAVDREPMSGLGLTGWATGLRTFALGVAVTGGSAVVVFGLGTWAGWFEWGPLDAAKLTRFLLVNALIAMALEAFPEELVFRGYVYASLSRALHRWTAFLTTVLLFCLVGAGSTVVNFAVGTLLGDNPPAPGFAPPGQDPVAYAVLFPVFGTVLLIARITTGSLWTSIAVHLTYLTVARITLEGADRGTGWSAQPTTPDALLLIPAFLLLTAVVFLLVKRRPVISGS
ncbi:CAAX protease self-immunity [Saccharopolyspora kobensis]|uniref:CAAX protease self-immunity n=1 Tax=Saccharopolyspora kobensis TaxID=146035 RepID=A0A1H6CRY5_9PSEU|nr:CPBP family intramembrane glutamic endopeptidase [Saccharopolyspora kobensis]SEG75537.1 CAAX protease self-immunity [Saccharopolyspora kobensis]SFC96902.1 CAAX protease self-immunity [Saccharopolyspora kobensis]